MLLFYAGLSLLVTNVVAALALVSYYNCKIPSAITIRKVKKKKIYIYIYIYMYVCMYVCIAGPGNYMTHKGRKRDRVHMDLG